jgi:hypothetical protein
MPLAHIAGVPLEELLLPAAGGGAALLAARVWLAAHLHRRRRSRGRTGSG